MTTIPPVIELEPIALYRWYGNHGVSVRHLKQSGKSTTLCGKDTTEDISDARVARDCERCQDVLAQIEAERAAWARWCGLSITTEAERA